MRTDTGADSLNPEYLDQKNGGIIDAMPDQLHAADAQALRLVYAMARAIAQHPDAVKVTPTRTEDGVTFTITAHPNDMGRLVGKEGHTAKSMRVVLAGTGMKHKRRYALVVGDAAVPRLDT